MKMPQITKRDAKIFFLGMFVMFLIVTIVEWEDAKAGFKEGYYDAINDFKK